MPPADTLVDTNILLDIVEKDPHWWERSVEQLQKRAQSGRILINPIIYTEFSIAFSRIEEVDKAILQFGLQIIDIPKEALFLAGKIYLQYRKNQGTKNSPLPDFFIGAHAAINQVPLLTRDMGRYHTYFPSIELITPDTH